MTIIHYAKELHSKNKYLINTKSTNYLFFLSLRFFYKVDYSNQITRNIYLGNYIDAANLSFIKNNNIKVIINCSKDIPFYVDKTIVPYQHRIPVNDDLKENSFFIMLQYLPSIMKYIDTYIKLDYNIYIHCHAGMQRSACVVAAYLIKYHKFSLDDAVKYIKSKRSICFLPMINFKKTLEKFSEEHL